MLLCTNCCQKVGLPLAAPPNELYARCQSCGTIRECHDVDPVVVPDASALTSMKLMSLLDAGYALSVHDI
jgi:hypothetical protein